MFGRDSHFALVKARIGEMDKALISLGRMARQAPPNPAGKKLIAELKRRRAQLQITATRMRTHISRAQAQVEKLNRAASVSWSAYRKALSKSQKAFARANRKTTKSIKRAVR